MSALKNGVLLRNRKAENRPLMKVIYSLLLLAPCLSALMISCCKYFLITVKLRDTAIFSLNNCQRRDYTTCKLTCASTLLMFIKFPGGYTKIFLKPLHIMPKTF